MRRNHTHLDLLQIVLLAVFAAFAVTKCARDVEAAPQPSYAVTYFCDNRNTDELRLDTRAKTIAVRACADDRIFANAFE